MEWILQIPILFFSVIVHEFAHGWVAYKNGDDTAYLSGRLTFNPIPHIDFVGTIIFPAICIFSGIPVFGWAKPVPVNPYKLRNYRKDMTKVAAAGPVSNILLAVVAAACLRIVAVMPWLGPDTLKTLSLGFQFAVMINLILAFFNLIPLFPLDGSRILSGVLPSNLRAMYEQHNPYGGFILIFLMMTGMLWRLIIPPVQITLLIFSKLGLL